MFASAVQLGLVSLFSSTGSDPLSLFDTHSDCSLPSDSFVCLLQDATSLPTPPPPGALISSTATSNEGDHDTATQYRLRQTVLHIQSPTLRTTYIRCPSSWTTPNSLGLKHPWIHMQVRNMGREWSFEVGVVDKSGRQGVVRCSTFQKAPKLQMAASGPPVLHLPLSFLAASSNALTSWSTIRLHLPSLLPHFSSAALDNAVDEDAGDSSDGDAPTGSKSRTRVTRLMPHVPGGSYSHVSYVKVYATCRLRRLWFSDAGPSAGYDFPWEFRLYGLNDVSLTKFSNTTSV